MKDEGIITIFDPPRIDNLVIPCGPDGSINISFKDGSVTLKNCELDSAAQAFWERVTQAFPHFRQTVIEGDK